MGVIHRLNIHKVKMKGFILCFALFIVSVNGCNKNGYAYISFQQTKYNVQRGLANDKTIYKYISHHPIDEVEKDEHDWSMLHYAASYGRTFAVDLLLKHGANVNIQDNLGWTPLHNAARIGKLELIKLLLSSQDINFNQQINVGWTAYDTAIHYGKRSAADLIKRTAISRGSRYCNKEC